MADPQPILHGNLDVLVLKALTAGPMHGYAITDWLEQRAGGNLELVDSALYQALYRLEGRRLVKPEWGITEKNRRAKFYHLTDAGRAGGEDAVSAQDISELLAAAIAPTGRVVPEGRALPMV